MNYTSRVGFWSAALTTLWAVAFDVSAGLGLVLPVGMAPILTSLLLAPSFVALVASLHTWAPERMKVWTQVALSFATIYATVVGINYFLQLTVVRVESLPLVALDPGVPHSIGWMFEILGYGFMVFAILFLVPLFDGDGIERWVRWLFLANAVGTFVGTIAYMLTVNALHVLVLVDLGLWGITFPLATALVAAWFRRIG